MFTLSNYGILDLAPCTLPWNAHPAQGFDHLFQRQPPKHPVVLGLLAAGKGKAANVLWSGRRNEKLSGHMRGKSWWWPWEEPGALVPLRWFSSGNASLTVQSDKESEKERQKDVRLSKWGRSWSTVAPWLSKVSEATSWMCYFCLSVWKGFYENRCILGVPMYTPRRHIYIYIHTHLFPCLKGECNNSPERCMFSKTLSKQ